MSWEEMRKDYRYFRCGCNNGRVTETTITEGDDWNRYREHKIYTIDCINCSTKYHLEGEYLVPTGLTISLKLTPSPKPYEMNIDFKINVLGRYTPEEIQEVICDMKEANNNNQLKLSRSKEVSHLFYRAYKRKKLSTIVPVLEELLSQYDLYENNHYRLLEKDKIELNEIILNNKIYNENISKCIKLIPM